VLLFSWRVGGRGCELSLSARLVGLFRPLAVLRAHITPYVLFTHGRVFFVRYGRLRWPGRQPDCSGVLSVVVRRLAHRTGCPHPLPAGMQFVTHEMRTPLSAIQGSSELISRYSLTEEKRKQVASHPFGIEAAGAHG